MKKMKMIDNDNNNNNENNNDNNNNSNNIIKNKIKSILIFLTCSSSLCIQTASKSLSGTWESFCDE